MSRGFGAYAKLIAEDESSVIYEYGSYNLNEPGHSNDEHIKDGTITIQKNCFVDSEIHTKLKKMPSGKKRLITKRIPVSVDYRRMLDEKSIVVENCSNCWEKANTKLGTDIMACHLLFYIFLEYQEQGIIPASAAYEV